jgi:dTDP-4-amino-4,6-dideoxy-D-galactose acyltransferase
LKNYTKRGLIVTVGEKKHRGDIGIIAVDTEFRGKGIGTALMQSAESWLAKLNYKSMQVVTQGDNKPACKLYENCGYTIESVEYFYHIRKK